MRVAAVYSSKGGVGKTSTTVNLAHEAAAAGVRVLVWDLDPQGATTYLLRTKAKLKGGSRRLVGEGELDAHISGTELDAVHLVPADFSLRDLDLVLDAEPEPTRGLARLLEGVAGSYDLALLDCSPGITRTSEAVFGAADLLVVPVVPATLASRSLGQVTRFLKGNEHAPALLPFVSMLDRRRSLHREQVAELAAAWPNLATAQIPASAHIERMGQLRTGVRAFAPKSPAAKAYADLWSEVAAALWPA